LQPELGTLAPRAADILEIAGAERGRDAIDVVVHIGAEQIGVPGELPWPISGTSKWPRARS
jgi:hypothetical protein